MQCGIYTYSGYYSPFKKTDSLIHASAWMNIKNIILGEISQTQKTRCRMIPFLYGVLRIVKYMETESRTMVSKSWGVGKIGNYSSSMDTECQYRVVKNALKMGGGDICTTV